VNNYRVDRCEEMPSPPCGMSSILYAGDNYADAMQVFTYTEGGKTAWNEVNHNCGVMLSKWNGEEFRVVRWKNK